MVQVQEEIKAEMKRKDGSGAVTKDPELQAALKVQDHAWCHSHP